MSVIEPTEMSEDITWVQIVDFPNYHINKFGIVENIETGDVIKQSIDSGGYFHINLNDGVKRKNLRTHRLVALAFIPNQRPETHKLIDHRDGCRTNNSISNLRWCDKSENAINRKIKSKNTSGVTGVCFHKHSGKWASIISINGKEKYAYFDTKEDAINHREEMERLHYGEFVPTRDIVITVRTTSTNPNCPTENKNDDSSVMTDSTAS